MVRVAPLPFVTTYAYVNPVVAVILGAIVLGEVIDPRTLVAGTIIIVAVALIVTARGRMAHRRPIAGPGRPNHPRAPWPPLSPVRSRRPEPPPRSELRHPGQVSARMALATRRLRAITVTIGLTPIPVGNSDPSPT